MWKQPGYECIFQQCHFPLIYATPQRPPPWYDNPCWGSVASRQQIWMLNPLAKHHSQSELAMINNPSREIWLGGMQAGDLREWVTAMSLLSGLSQIGNHTPRKHEMFIWLMSGVFWKHGCFATSKLGLRHGTIKWELSCECVSYLKAGHIHASAHLFKYRLLRFGKESAHRVTLRFTSVCE